MEYNIFEYNKDLTRFLKKEGLLGDFLLELRNRNPNRSPLTKILDVARHSSISYRINILLSYICKWSNTIQGSMFWDYIYKTYTF